MKIPQELQMAMMMAMVGGANVIAPKEISKNIKEDFPVDEDAIIYMKKAFSMINGHKDSTSLLVHTILDNLPLVQIMKLREVVGNLAVEILKYLDENPEFREAPKSFDEVKEIFDDFTDE